MWKSIFTFTAFLFYGCNCEIVGINTNTSYIQANKCMATLSLKKVAQEFDNGKLEVTRQYYLTNDNKILVHENLRLNDNYEFVIGSTSLMQIGFNLKNYSVKSAGNYHDAIYGTDINGEKVYLIYSGIKPFEEIDVIYTKNLKLIQQLIPCISSKVPLKISIFANKKKSEFQDYKKYKISNWNDSIFLFNHIANSKFFDF